MNTLRIALPPLASIGAATAFEFALLSNGRVARGGKAGAAELPRADRTELIVGADDVLLLAVQVPPLSGARLRAALPHLIEDRLLGAPEESFVAIGPASRDPLRALAVVQRAPLERALRLLAQAGVAPAAAWPEQLTLPLAQGGWTCAAGESHCTVRTGALSGFATGPATADSPPAELMLALRGANPAVRALAVWGEIDAARWSDAAGIPVQVVRANRFVFDPPAFDLLQFELSPVTVDWKVWRAPAVLAAACALIAILGLNLHWFSLAGEQRDLRERMERTLREAFPDTTVVLDPALQLKRRVADLRAAGGANSADDFIPLANALGEALKAKPGAVKSMEYRDGRLQLVFQPSLVDAPAKREALVSQLRGAGLALKFSENTAFVARSGS